MDQIPCVRPKEAPGSPCQHAAPQVGSTHPRTSPVIVHTLNFKKRVGLLCPLPWLADRLLFPDSGLCFLALLMDVRPNSDSSSDSEVAVNVIMSLCHSRSGVTEDEQRVSGTVVPVSASPVSGVTCSCVSPSFYKANSCSLCLQTGFLSLITGSAFSLNSDPRVPWVCSVSLQTSSQIRMTFQLKRPLLID